MSDGRALVAVDLGADSCRVSLLRPALGVPTPQLVHRFQNGPVASEAGLHWPIAAIEQGVDEGLRLCAPLAPEGIRSVAVDGWAVDYVRLSADGHAEGPPHCYRDERTVAAEAWVHARTSVNTLRRLTGVQVQRINTAYQLVADALAAKPAARWLNLPEYLLYRLGADPVAELTNASHTQLVSAGCGCWSTEAFRLLGLDMSLAPRIVAPGTVVGGLRGELCDLSAYEDTLLIAPACHDTASAVAGIPGMDEASAYISAGTWSLVGTLLAAPEIGEQACMGDYTNLAAAGGLTLFHRGMQGMWLLQRCLQHWQSRGDTVPEIEALIAAAEQVPTPVNLLRLDDPELMLPHEMPARLARQVHAPDFGVETAAACAALIFHSLAAEYAMVLRKIAAITRRRFQRIYVVGGASRNRLLNRLIEQATGIPVMRGPAEAATHGNFAVQLALLASGTASAAAVGRWAHALHASRSPTNGV